MQEKYKERITEEMVLQGKKEILCTSMEECCELAQAISKYISEYKKDSENIRIKENIAKEMADVLICMEKVKEICNISDSDVEEWVDEKTLMSKKKILSRLRKNSRRIDICQEDVCICGELEVMDAEIPYINAAYELWLDVDKYFGTETMENDDVWINFYTDWYMNGDIRAWLYIESSKTVITLPWDLTQNEKVFFTNKMGEAAQKQCKKSLVELLKEVQD